MSDVLREQLTGSLAVVPQRPVQHDLMKQVRAAEVLRAGLAKITDDAETIRDTIEGETTLHEKVRAVLLSIDDDLAMLEGLRARLSELSSRKARFEDRVEAKRALVEQALLVGEIQSIETDLATVSLRTVAPRPVAVNEADIPSEFWIPQPPKLDLKKLATALKDGPVVGAELSNGGVCLSIRRG